MTRYSRMSQRSLIELLYGNGAHVNTLKCVEDVQFELAGGQAENCPHSIWQLVYHMNFWMEYELKRIGREKPNYPAHASETWPVKPVPPSQEEWQQAIALFRDHLAAIMKIAQSAPDVLAQEVDATHAEHTRTSNSIVGVLWQTLAHNSYHIGQVAMLRRILGAWPPKGGGDTW